MESASSLAYPGSRILAGWWRQLQPYRPAGLWVGYLFVHRVEALVESVEPRPVDGLALHVLQALAIDHPAEGPHEHRVDPLPARLHLPAPALQQLLIGLADRNLVRRCEPGCWCLSEHGREVVRAGADLATRRERRAFLFAERLNPTGRRLGPPHFLPLAECPATPWTVDEAHSFDVGLLRDAAGLPADWKERHGFPTGVRAVAAGDDTAWQAVVVDRPERAFIVLTTGDDRDLLGFAARPDGWKLLDSAPVLRLAKGTREALPELTVPAHGWEEAWRLWCRQRHLPLSEAEACRLRLNGIHLDVEAPESFVQRLRVAKSDLLREESGLLAGDGYLRAAALLRLVPS
jgi:hypothetical protein